MRNLESQRERGAGRPGNIPMAAVVSSRLDGEGAYWDGPVGWLHRRLSIIDLSGGAQPMSNEDGSV